MSPKYCSKPSLWNLISRNSLQQPLECFIISEILQKLGGGKQVQEVMKRILTKTNLWLQGKKIRN